MNKLKFLSILILGAGIFQSIFSQDTNTGEVCPISTAKFYDSIRHWNLYRKKNGYERLDSCNVTGISENLLKYQNDDGGWPKNFDWLAKLDPDSLKNSLASQQVISTLDNRNTFPQIEYLAKAYMITGKNQYMDGAAKGIDFLLTFQNKSGGWQGWDVDAITFNDEITTGAMNLFLDIIEGKEIYSWVSDAKKDEIKTALKRAIDVVLNCQIVVNGEKTAWCQQHDHKTFVPVKARTFELPSITANESVPVIEFLMRVKNPSEQVIDAINSAITWLEKSAMQGFRLERIPVDRKKYPEYKWNYDLKVVNDPESPRIWARFYNIKDNKPFLCRRDGTVVFSLEEVDIERRTGYDWYGYWPEKLLTEEYPEWLKKNQSLNK